MLNSSLRAVIMAANIIVSCRLVLWLRYKLANVPVPVKRHYIIQALPGTYEKYWLFQVMIYGEY